MRYFLFSFLPVFLALSLKAQDQIITYSNDTISCRITYVGNLNITYTKVVDKNRVAKVMALRDIKEYFIKDEAAVGRAANPKQNSYSSTSTFRNFSLPPLEPSINLKAYYGYSYAIASAETDNPLQKEYIKDLRSGSLLGLGAVYFYNEQSGVGVNYTQSNFSAMFRGVFDNGSAVTSGTVSDNVKITNVEVVYSGRSRINGAAAQFIYSFGLGYSAFSNHGIAIDHPFKQTGSSGTFLLDGGLAITLDQSIQLLAIVQYNSNAFANIETSEYNGSFLQASDFQPQANFSRFTFSVGVQVPIIVKRKR